MKRAIDRLVLAQYGQVVTLAAQAEGERPEVTQAKAFLAKP